MSELGQNSCIFFAYFLFDISCQKEIFSLPFNVEVLNCCFLLIANTEFFCTFIQFLTNPKIDNQKDINS